MKCPHCGKDIKEHLITEEAARIMGRRSRRELTHDQAVEIGRRGGLKRAENLRKDKENG
jgi:general stress protein YciG